MRTTTLALACCLFSATPLAAYANDFDIDRAIKRIQQQNIEQGEASRKERLTDTLSKAAENLARMKQAGFRLNDRNVLVPLDSEDEPIEADNPFPVGLDPLLGVADEQPELTATAQDAPEKEATKKEEGKTKDPFSAEGDEAFIATPVLSPSKLPSLHAVINDRAVFSLDGQLESFRAGEELPGGHKLVGVHADGVSLESSDGTERSINIDWRSATPEQQPQPARATYDTYRSNQ